MADEEPKIIIDEDWKAQVDRERQESTVKPDLAQGESGDTAPEGEEELTIFESLISGMAAQTMMSLGLMAPEGDEQVVVDLGLAHHLIETLGMLKEKTQGNLNEREAGGLNEAVSELQRVFAVRVQQARENAMNNPGANPQGPPKL